MTTLSYTNALFGSLANVPMCLHKSICHSTFNLVLSYLEPANSERTLMSGRVVQ